MGVELLTVCCWRLRSNQAASLSCLCEVCETGLEGVDEMGWGVRGGGFERVERKRERPPSPGCEGARVGVELCLEK